MDIVQALNVTIYGLGIVFLALLVLMVSIMVLGKLFAVATGKEFLVAAPATSEAVAPTVPAAPQPTAAGATGSAAMAAPVAFKMGVAGKQFKVEVSNGANGASTVVIDGSSFQVERDRADARRVVVNGKAHTLEIKEVNNSFALVVIDGVPQRIELAREALPAAAAPPPAAPAPAVAPPQAAPAATPATAAPRAPAAGEQVTAPLPGKILSVAVKVGDVVRRGDELCVIEAMKMGNSIKTQRDGTVRDVLISPGDTVGFGAPLVVVG